MSFVNTDKVGLSLARQTGFGTLGGSPTWRRQQPNGFPNFGASLSTVQREPISTARQLGPGVPVALDAAGEFDADITMQLLIDLMESFVFSQAANWNLVFEGAPATATGYTIPSTTAAQAAKLQWNAAGAGSKTLIFARGYANAANNGLKVLSADTGLAATTLTTGSGVVETPPTNAIVEVAGIRAVASDLALFVTGSTGTLTSAGGANGINWTTVGVFVGQFIHIGGLVGANQFTSGVGYARITAITATVLTLDKITGTLVTDAGTSPDTVDILFGRFIRNLPVDHDTDDDRYSEIYLQAELTSPDLSAVGVDMYEYLLDGRPSKITLSLPLSEKGTVNVALKGSDVEVPTTSRKTNAATPILPLQVEAFSTAINIGNLRTSLLSAADTGFKNVTITLDNNVNDEKVLAQLPSKSLPVGIFKVQIGAEMLFGNASQISSPRANATISFDTLIKNADGACFLDIPSMKLEDAKRDYPKNKGVTISLPGTAFEDPVLHTSFSASFFPVVP